MHVRFNNTFSNILFKNIAVVDEFYSKFYSCLPSGCKCVIIVIFWL